MSTRRAKLPFAFTLLELVVVLAIITAALALLLPAVQKVRHAAKGIRCSDNLRQLALACHHAHDVHNRMPPAYNWFPAFNPSNLSAGLGPLFFHLLPWIEQDSLYKSSRFQADSHDFFNYQEKANASQVKLFNCPLDPSLPELGGPDEVRPHAASNYAGNFLVFGIVNSDWSYRSPLGRPNLALSFPDGTGHTILFAEKYAVAAAKADVQPATRGGCCWCIWGMKPYNPFFALYVPEFTDPHSVGPGSRFQVQPKITAVNPGLCASGHSQGMNAAMADGSVRLLARAIKPDLWWGLVTPHGNEIPD